MIPKPIADVDLIARLGRLEPDGIEIFTIENDSLKGAVVNASAMVNRMRANHGLSIQATLALGHAYVAAALLSTTIKGDDLIQLRYEGDGPAGGFWVEASARGEVRGRLFDPEFGLDAPPEDFDTAPMLGSGSLSLFRRIAGKAEPFVGRVGGREGRIGADLAAYFLESEQLPTAFRVGLHFDTLGRVTGAGGFYLQAMPGAAEESLDRAQRLVAGLPSPALEFASGLTRRDYLVRSFSFFDLNLLGPARAEFFCACTKERLAAFISSMRFDELDQLAEEGPFPTEVRCHNCGSTYRYEQSELRAMRDSRAKS
jgi:molecular chaperone Hsp33